jgi:hypothetical protein
VFAACDIDKQIGQRIEKVRTTAYTHGAAENGAYPGSNAIGTPLKSGTLSSAAIMSAISFLAQVLATHLLLLDVSAYKLLPHLKLTLELMSAIQNNMIRNFCNL